MGEIFQLMLSQEEAVNGVVDQTDLLASMSNISLDQGALLNDFSNEVVNVSAEIKTLVQQFKLKSLEENLNDAST